ncbi:MAG: alcohol dehydrogenase catalytic domain-containing protein [Gammaproteobacteria bacterium]
MRAAVFKGVGQPLAVENVPEPTPGPEDVIIKVGRCGVCATDLDMTSAGGWAVPPGSVIGHEMAGEIVAVGGSVERLKVGDRITSFAFVGCGHCGECERGEGWWCENKRPGTGGFAQYAMTGQFSGFKLPQGVSTADGALVEPLSVGLHSISAAQMPHGARVLVLGCGPIGLATIFWARRLGAGRVLAAAPSKRRESIALAMGATSFLTLGEDFAERMKADLGGLPDVVFECAGAPGAIARCIDWVRPRGTVALLGYCTGADQFVPAIGLLKEVRLQYSMVYNAREYQYCIDVLDSGAVEPRAMVSQTVGLDAFPAALEAMRERNTQNKLLVDPWA